MKNKTEKIREAIQDLHTVKEVAATVGDFNTFAQLCQDIRQLERELRELEGGQNGK